MAHLPFYVFKRTGHRFYSVKFKNEKTGKYLPARSTKKESEIEAIRIAFEWLKNGITTNGEALDSEKYTLRNMAKQAEITKPDAIFILKELKRRSFLKSYVLYELKQIQSFSA